LPFDFVQRFFAVETEKVKPTLPKPEPEQNKTIGVWRPPPGSNVAT